MAMKDYKMTACLKKRKEETWHLSLLSFWLLSLPVIALIFGVWVTVALFFCIFMRFEKPRSALRFLNICLFSSNLYANKVPFVMVRCSLTVLINENYYYCTFNLSSF